MLDTFKRTIDLFVVDKRERDEREAIREKSHTAEVGGLRTTIGELKGDLARRDEEIRWYREKYEREDKDRDTRLGRLEEAIAQRTAPRVHELNKPDTEATATAATATAINASRKRESLLELARWVAIVIVFVLTMLGVKLPTETKTDITVPDTKPRPAGTGFAGAP